MNEYPLTLRIAGRLAVVVGGGSVALRRATALLAAGAVVRIVAIELTPSLEDLARSGRLLAARREYRSGDLAGAWLVHACTDRPEVNALVAAESDERGIWCVRADSAADSAAWVPAVGHSGHVTLAVTTGDPRRSVALREALLAALPGLLPPPLRSGPRPGRVAIVGGGPGHPGLITKRGYDLLLDADVVVADRLAPLALLDGLRPDVEIVDAAKIPGGPSMAQEMINEILIERARTGRRVVRLKGGDPFVFGRGHEEVQACIAAGVDVEVVPGVSSAIAGPAMAGIPVTHRGLAQGFSVVSGHVPPDDPRSDVDWGVLARARTTLVLLMAVDNLAKIIAALVGNGLDPNTPAAAVMSGSTSEQREVVATVGTLIERLPEGGIANPAVIVIGAVVGLHDLAPRTTLR